MPRPSSSRPTDSELEILGVLWDKGAATVREVHEELSQETNGLHHRIEVHADHDGQRTDHPPRTAPRPPLRIGRPREATQSELVRDLAQRAFGGSALELAMRALESNRATPGELDQIRRLLDQAEKGRR